MGYGGGHRAFIGSFTSAGGCGITAAAMDPGTGALTITGATDEVPDPSFLAPAPGGTVLYAVSETPDGAVAALDITGPAPRLIGGPVPVRGAGPTHLALAADHVITANYGSGSVSVLPLGADGAPGGPGARGALTVLEHAGAGPDPERQEGPHAHQVVVAPGGRWLLAVDLGTDSVHVHDLSGGAPARHAETALPPGTGPRHLAFHPAGSHVYVLGELEPTLTVCRWDAAAGTLEPLHRTGVLPGALPGVPPADAPSRNYPSGIAVAPDGRFAWAAVRGGDSLAVLALDDGRERPEPVATVPCGGHWPRDLALDPEGRRLYVANERSGDVTWFDLDPTTGVPARAGAVEAPAASCVVFV
ncbi:lactonase family protein [Streptomyces sp. NPDC013953]|uniref:lactonase family protein n=1 Tax=Streptomyces sp. NPDC013953 TaxID=3364868 RepID=UPI0036FCD65C